MEENKEKIRKEQEELVNKLLQINVNEHVEKKNTGGSTLSYLSWAWAWQEFLKICPDATYEIRQFEDNIGGKHCYQYDENLGYMVFTSITAGGLTKEMWLPVMDGANKAMKSEPYTYRVKKYEYDKATGKKEFAGYEEKTVEAATMFDINKTIMRCLTKNIAMFGLGLYIYAGEDLPEEIIAPITAEQIAKFKELDVNIENVLKNFNVAKVDDLSSEQARYVINVKNKSLAKVTNVKSYGNSVVNDGGNTEL